MNIKAYIDQFHEISHLKREEQFSLLERASNDANSRLKLLNFYMIALLIRMLFIMTIVGGSYFIFGYSALLLIITIFLSLLLSTIVTTEINTYLLSRSLKDILNKDNL